MEIKNDFLSGQKYFFHGSNNVKSEVGLTDDTFNCHLN